MFKKVSYEVMGYTNIASYEQKNILRQMHETKTLTSMGIRVQKP